MVKSFEAFRQNVRDLLRKCKQVSEVSQSCPTLCDPTDCSLPGSSVHGIFQARILEWVAISFSRGSSPPRDWNRVSRIVGRRFTIWATWGAPYNSASVDKTSQIELILIQFVSFSECHIYIALPVKPKGLVITSALLWTKSCASVGTSWWSVAKTPHSQCRGPGFNSWSGN